MDILDEIRELKREIDEFNADPDTHSGDPYLQRRLERRDELMARLEEED